MATATTGPVNRVVAMALSVSAVLANSFAGRLLSGERVNAGFAVETDDAVGAMDEGTSADQATTS